MAYTTINKSTTNFNNVTYTGNGGTQSITGVGHQPDWVWIKERNSDVSHQVFDVIRGATKRLYPDDTSGENTNADSLTAFNADGFSLGSAGSTNGNSDTYVSWNWKAGGAGSANTDGDINSTVSVNQTAGFSIVKYTGSGSAQTVGHGLNAVPKWIIVKRIPDNGYDWVVYHTEDSAGLYLNSNGYNADSSSNNIWFNGAAPTSSVFTTGTDGRIGNAVDYIAYCFAEKKGYSKFGSYIGNGNADGTFVYTGFKPAWVMVKRSNGTDHWYIIDNKRIGFNEKNYGLYANLTNVEYTGSVYDLDILSNGFKARDTDAMFNDAGSSYIYMAFAAEPLVANVGGGVPATAV